MRAFVTGAGGFVGSWLVAHLRDQGDEVVAVDSEVDVTDPKALQEALVGFDPAAVYHLAALTHVGRSFTDPSEVVRVNALGTLSVLEASRQCAEPPNVLVVSSAEVYGAVKESDLPVGEEAPLAPMSPYAASKIAAEYLAIQAHLVYGLPVIRVRPFNHVGPGQSTHFAVPALVVADRRGEEERRTMDSGRLPGCQARPHRCSRRGEGLSNACMRRVTWGRLQRVLGYGRRDRRSSAPFARPCGRRPGVACRSEFGQAG